MLNLLSFTGVDDHTSIFELEQISNEYWDVEFGILLGGWSDWTGDARRIKYASFDTIEKFRESAVRNKALHLCGSYAYPYPWELEEAPFDIVEFCKGFDRVQLNLPPDAWVPSYAAETVEGVRTFADKTNCKHVILQHGGSWDDVPFTYPKVEYLFDVSKGNGVDSISIWPEPDLADRRGYAGGLGPHNISKAMDFVNRFPGTSVWLDMESGVRDGTGIDAKFDLNAVRNVCRQVF